MTKDERVLELLKALLDISRGTLWFVKDQLWEKAIPDFVVKRKGHAGLSLGMQKVESLQDMMPMLIGTSKTGGSAFYATGVFAWEKHPRRTYFSAIRPCLQTSYRTAAPKLGVKDFLGQDPLVERNHDKPSLDGEEMGRFEEFLKNRGLG